MRQAQHVVQGQQHTSHSLCSVAQSEKGLGWVTRGGLKPSWLKCNLWGRLGRATTPLMRIVSGAVAAALTPVVCPSLLKALGLQSAKGGQLLAWLLDE